MMGMMSPGRACGDGIGLCCAGGGFPRSAMKRAASPKAAARAISGEAFVRAWQAARSAEEAAEKLGLPVEGVRARAARYRKKGVPLQRFGGGGGA